jgi:uncharacterized RDD family membrane protein YckC
VWQGGAVNARVAWRRIVAWEIDCLCILGWVAITLAVGLPLYLTGAVHISGLLLLNVVGALVIVVPVVLALAALEHWRGATIGKRLLGLDVERHARPPSLARTLIRNLLKVGLPWMIGHAAVFAVATDPTPATSALLIAAYVLPIAYAICLFVGHGQTPYDLLAGTIVRHMGRHEPVGTNISSNVGGHP